jgi:lactate dehydrogenase-like 2-hydroxyacid dehydrogenase
MKVICEVDKTNIPEEVTNILKPYAEVVYVKKKVLEHLEDAIAILVGSAKINAELLDKAPNLKVVSRFGVGYDAVDVQECTKRKIYATHTPGVLSSGVADHTWALILGFMRNIPEAENISHLDGKWKERFLDSSV